MQRGFYTNTADEEEDARLLVSSIMLFAMRVARIGETWQENPRRLAAWAGRVSPQKAGHSQDSGIWRPKLDRRGASNPAASGAWEVGGDGCAKNSPARFAPSGAKGL